MNATRLHISECNGHMELGFEVSPVRMFRGSQPDELLYSKEAARQIPTLHYPHTIILTHMIYRCFS